MIMNRPALYEDYVNTLADVLVEKFDQAKTINKLSIWSKTHELAMYAMTNRVSLLGIINYDVANLNNSKSFFINLNSTMLPGAEKTHNSYVADTIKYLNGKKVKYKTERKETGTLFEILN